MRRELTDLQNRIDKNNNQFKVIAHNENTDITTVKCLLCGFTFDINDFRTTGRKFTCKICGKSPSKLTLQNVKDQVKFKSDYNMEFVSASYTNSKQKYDYLCKKCGKITVKTHDRFLAGERCYHCAHEESASKQRSGWKNIVKQLEELYPDAIFTPIDDIDLSKLTVQDRVNFYCKKCGNTTTPRIRHLLYEHTTCRKCKESNGERMIRELLLENGVQFEQYYKGFEDCKNTKVLEFDFFLPEYNTIIEFDGIFHRKQIGTSTESARKYNNTLENDLIKDNYCRDNHINLIRINSEKEIYEKLKIFIK